MPKPVCHSNLPALKVEETCGCRWMCPCELSVCVCLSLPITWNVWPECWVELEPFQVTRGGRNCCSIVIQRFKQITGSVKSPTDAACKFRATLSLFFALAEWQCFIRESHTPFPKLCELGRRMYGRNQEFISASCKQAKYSWSILGLEGLACPQSSRCNTITILFNFWTERLNTER